MNDREKAELFENMNSREKAELFRNQKIAVNCRTAEEANAFVRWCNRNGVGWYDKSTNTCFDSLFELTTYAYDSNRGFHFRVGPVKEFKDEGYVILLYSDLFRKMEYDQPVIEYISSNIDKLTDDDHEPLCRMLLKLEDREENCEKCSDSCRFYRNSSLLKYLNSRIVRPLQVTKVEYDLLMSEQENSKELKNSDMTVNDIPVLSSMKDRGYFGDIPDDMKLSDVYRRICCLESGKNDEPAVFVWDEDTKMYVIE